MEDVTASPGKKPATRGKAPRAAKPKLPKPSKVPPSAEAVAAHLLEMGTTQESPILWKEAELKRKLLTAERPVFAVALERLQAAHQVLALKQGKTALYLFAGPLRAWLKEGEVLPAPMAAEILVEDVFAAYTAAVRQSGGFPDVKVSALGTALGAPAAKGRLAGSLTALWREGRATFSQGDWSLADEATRAAAVEINGEKYLLVRLEDEV